MYERFYGLREEPFRLAPDSRYVFEHPSYAKAKAYLEYGITRREGVVMVTGEPGSGKTTLVDHLLSRLPRSTRVAHLVSTQVEALDLLRMVLFGFGLDASVRTKAEALVSLQRLLRSGRDGEREHVLLVDEAQDLAANALEELRLLTNVNDGGRRAFQVFLIGQDELLERVRSPGLEQLHQRVVAAHRLQPLDAEQTRAYIERRLRVAGWSGNPGITRRALVLIHGASGGNPRRINMLCGRLLLHGYVEGLHLLTDADVNTVVKEMGTEQLAVIADHRLQAATTRFRDEPAELERTSALQTGQEPRLPAVGGLAAAFEAQGIEASEGPGVGRGNDDSAPRENTESSTSTTGGGCSRSGVDRPWRGSVRTPHRSGTAVPDRSLEDDLPPIFGDTFGSERALKHSSRPREALTGGNRLHSLIVIILAAIAAVAAFATISGVFRTTGANRRDNGWTGLRAWSRV